MPFSGLVLSKLKKKIRVIYVYIEESFDTIFNMGYGGGGYRTPLHALSVGKITHAFNGYGINESPDLLPPSCESMQRGG